MSYFTANLTREEDEVRDELARQDAKWGEQSHPDGTGGSEYRNLARDWKYIVDAAAKQGKLTWRQILCEEVYEALAEDDPEELLGELLQVEAVARQWRMAIRRRLAAGVDADAEAVAKVIRDVQAYRDVWAGDGEGDLARALLAAGFHRKDTPEVADRA